MDRQRLDNGFEQPKKHPEPLRKVLLRAINTEELNKIALLLGTSIEQVGGTRFENQIQNLITFSENRLLMTQLLSYIHLLKPNIDLSDFNLKNPIVTVVQREGDYGSTGLKFEGYEDMFAFMKVINTLRAKEGRAKVSFSSENMGLGLVLYANNKEADTALTNFLNKA